MERCHTVELLFRASDLIMTVFRAVFGSNALIAFDTVHVVSLRAASLLTFWSSRCALASVFFE